MKILDLNEIKDIINIGDDFDENKIINRINTLLEELDKVILDFNSIGLIDLKEIPKEEKAEEKKKNEEEKNKIFEKQKEFRIKEISNIYKKEETKEVLEDMCIIGTIMKNEIIEEKKITLINLFQLKRL